MKCSVCTYEWVMSARNEPRDAETIVNGHAVCEVHFQPAMWHLEFVTLLRAMGLMPESKYRLDAPPSR